MKVDEFLALTDRDKIAILENCEVDGNWEGATEDKGKCNFCGNEANIGDFCWGCYQLVCQNCVEREPHFSDCYNK